jgi:superfamily II DNA or RNA helicase
MLYKRAFQKEKEVTTFLIKARMVKLAWNFRIEPRPYQSGAAKWALGEGQAVCSLPTGTGKDAGSCALAKIALCRRTSR